MPLPITGIIQQLVAPAVMISACGLIVLALYNRFALLMTNLRNCLEACRSEMTSLPKAAANDIEYFHGSEPDRARSLVRKLRLLRSALVCLMLCIVCMVLCSLTIGASMIVASAERVALWLFLAGLVHMLAGVGFAVRELLYCLQGLAVPQLDGIDQQPCTRQAA